MAREQGYWKQFNQQRWSRRRALQYTAVGSAGLAAVTVLGCGGAERSSSTLAPEAKQPKRGGTLTHKAASESEGNLLDPHRQPNTVAILMRL